MFFKFVDCFQDQTFSQDIKAMILQHIIIPMFEESFKKGMIFVSECLPRTVVMFYLFNLDGPAFLVKVLTL